jgi:spore germination protein GerM
LQTVQRFVQVPAPLSSIITALLAGPDRTEAAQGITSAIPDNVDLLSVKTQGAVVTVNFNAAFEDEITGSNTELAVAQVVGTVVAQTALTTGVLFEIDGVPISVPIASGAQVPGPVYGGQVTGAS